MYQIAAQNIGLSTLKMQDIAMQDFNKIEHDLSLKILQEKKKKSKSEASKIQTKKNQFTW